MADGTAQDWADLVARLGEIERRERRQLARHLFPARTHDWLGQTYHRRDLYPQHLAFFAAGAAFRERAFRAANRVGKSTAGAYEMRCHLTGRYPDWWQGRRFDTPIDAWAAGKTTETTRDIVMRALLGDATGGGVTRHVSGTGTVEGDLIGALTWRQGVPGLIESARVRHVSGGWSVIGLKSYEQGRGSFEGTARHVVWLDEEPPADIYSECLTRTMTVDGVVYLTYTPLDGLSDVVRLFQGDDVTKI